MVCTWKAIRDRNGPMPPQVDAAEWALWDAYWRQTDVQDNVYINRQNRASQSDAAGRAVHHLGRRSTLTDYYQSVCIYMLFFNLALRVCIVSLITCEMINCWLYMLFRCHGRRWNPSMTSSRRPSRRAGYGLTPGPSIAVCLCCLKFIFVHYYKLFLKNSNWSWYLLFTISGWGWCSGSEAGGRDGWCVVNWTSWQHHLRGQQTGQQRTNIWTREPRFELG